MHGRTRTLLSMSVFYNLNADGWQIDFCMKRGTPFDQESLPLYMVTIGCIKKKG